MLMKRVHVGHVKDFMEQQNHALLLHCYNVTNADRLQFCCCQAYLRRRQTSGISYSEQRWRSHKSQQLRRLNRWTSATSSRQKCKLLYIPFRVVVHCTLSLINNMHQLQGQSKKNTESVDDVFGFCFVFAWRFVEIRL